MNIAKDYELCGISFKDFFLDENMKTAFRSSKQFSGFQKFIIDVKEKTLTAFSYGNKVELAIVSEMPAEFVIAVTESELEVNRDLKRFARRLKSDIEPIMVLPLNDESIPYMITTQTIIEKGGYSPKYQLGLLYYLNLKLAEMNKEQYSNIGEAIVELGRKIKDKNLSFQIKLDGGSTYFETTISELVEAI